MFEFRFHLNFNLDLIDFLHLNVVDFKNEKKIGKFPLESLFYSRNLIKEKKSIKIFHYYYI